MGWKVISKDYPSPLCYQVPLLIYALREQRGWKRWQLAEAAGIALREVELLEKPGHRPNLDMLDRVANTFLFSLPEFLALAETIPLPANRSLTVCPCPVPLALPPLPKWARPPATRVPTG